jgi:hypothetical protein
MYTSQISISALWVSPTSVILHIEWFIKQITGIWTCSTLYLQMIIQTMRLSEWFITKKNLYGCSTQFMHWCNFTKPCSLNDLLHTIHSYGHFLQCMQWCLLKSPCFLKDLLHVTPVQMIFTKYALVHLQITLFSELFLTNFTHTWIFYTIFALSSDDVAPSMI